MPKVNSHISLAVHNIDCACHLNRTSRFLDWTATVSFYAALHVIEAIFASQEPVLHGQCHQRREELLKKEYDKIYIPYHALRQAADVARYLDKKDCFALFMTPEEVQQILLQSKLASILKTALKTSTFGAQHKKQLQDALQKIEDLPAQD